MESQLAIPDQFNGYTRIEYMSVFISFLYALVISEFFTGWTKMVRNRLNLILSIDHLIYTILFFWVLLLNWWSLWMRMPFLGNGFLYFILIIAPLAISYFVTVFMFPDIEKERDLSKYFDQNFKIIGIGLAAFIITNLLVGLSTNENLTAAITIFRIINGVLIFIIAFFNLKKLRQLFAFIMTLGLLLSSVQVAFA